MIHAKSPLWLVVALTAVVSLFTSRAAIAADKPAELRIDYATYNPSSLVLKKFGWLEEDLEADGVPVKWVFSAWQQQGQ